MYAGARVVVLGASGFIGRWVARQLAAAGADLTLPVRDAAGMRALCDRYGIRGQVQQVDLRDASGLLPLFRAVRPAITFNLAGYGVDRAERDEAMAFAINARLLLAVAAAAAAYGDPGWSGQQIIHAGSALEYGEIGGNLHEESAPNATTLYGRSKLAGTLALREASRANALRSMTARLFTVYGPGEHDGRLLPSLLRAAGSGAPLPLTAGAQQRDFTYVEDVAEGLLRLGQVETAVAGHIVNLATGRLATVRQFVETAARVLDISPGALQFGALPTRREEMAHEPVAVARLLTLTGWKPEVTVAEGVARTRAFEARHLGRSGTDR
jgi:nucleoside-diphosphate-sugar epimerase